MSSTNKKFGFKRATELRNASEISKEELTELKSITHINDKAEETSTKNISDIGHQGDNIKNAIDNSSNGK